MIPIGRGQRELIVGDRQTGKLLLQEIDLLAHRARIGRVSLKHPCRQRLPVYTRE